MSHCDSNKGRIITLVCEITTDKYPEWIFDSHLKKNLGMGVRVKSIHEGDLTDVRETVVEDKDLSDQLGDQAREEFLSQYRRLMGPKDKSEA